MSNQEFLALPGPSSVLFARLVVKQLNCEMVDMEFKEFADGENYFRLISDVAGKRVLVIQSLYPPVDHHLMQLIFISKKLSEEGAFVYAICPYLSYSRQHREYLTGEVMSLRTVGQLLTFAGVKHMITLDIHNAEGLGLIKFPAFSPSAIPTLAEYVKNCKDISNSIIVSPDLGSSARAEAFAELVGRPYLVFEKERDRFTGEVKMKSRSSNLSGSKAYIVDDMISTGGTIVKAAKVLSSLGVKEMTAVCVHAIMVADAGNRIKAAGVSSIIASNTIPTEFSEVDVSKVVADYINLLG